MKITTFKTDFTTSKFAKSPYEDLTFEFTNIETDLNGALLIMQKEFVLNRNYVFNGILKARRTKKDLKKYLSKKLEFVIVDFDEVKSLYDRNSIINFFREKDYRVGLIPSRSYNGIDNFNMKGIIVCRGFNNKPSIRGILNELNEHLLPYCKIDMTSMNEGGYQAPSLLDEIIYTNNDGRYIPNFKLKEIEKKNVEFNIPDNHSDVMDICLSEYTSRGFSLTKINEEKGLLTFSHPSEKTPNGYFLFLNSPFNMKHFNSERSFNIFDSVKNKQPVKDYIEKINHAKRETEFSGVGVSDKLLSINQRYINVTETEKKFISSWLDSGGLFKLKSAMGTGKSNVISEVINQCEKRELKVLLITNRVSVAEDFQTKYNIKLYSDGNYEIGDDLIVQFDSLWKYSLKHFDIVVLDEFVSVLLHSRNEMGEYSNLNRVKLMYSMKNKLCMIADAFLFGIEDRFIPTKPKFSIVNDYRENLSTKKYESVNDILNVGIETAVSEQKKGKKTTFSCTSKSTAKSIETICKELGLKTLLLSADTQEEEKKDIYDTFGLEEHDFWDVLIYTPTITVGISVLSDINNHFHIDESMSVDSISSMQMIRRTRKSKIIHFYVRERKRYLETRIETLNSEVRNNIENFYKKNNSLMVEVDEHGDFKMSKIALFTNEIEVLYNKLENNHRHSFELLLKHQINNETETVKGVSTEYDINSIKRQIKEEEVQRMKSVILKMEEIDYGDFVLDDFGARNFLINDKQKMQKLMSEIRKSFIKIKPKKLKEITLLEISKGFKMISKLKKLKFYQTNDLESVKNLLSFLVSENGLDKGHIQFYKYVLQLKKNSIKLKTKISILEIKKVNEKIGWGDFRMFLLKCGYTKRGGNYFLSEEYNDLWKLIK